MYYIHVLARVFITRASTCVYHTCSDMVDKVFGTGFTKNKRHIPWLLSKNYPFEALVFGEKKDQNKRAGVDSPPPHTGNAHLKKKRIGCRPLYVG